VPNGFATVVTGSALAVVAAMTAELSAIAALTSIFVITWCRRSATGASVLEPSRPSLAIRQLVVLGLQLTLRSPFQYPDAVYRGGHSASGSRQSQWVPGQVD